MQKAVIKEHYIKEFVSLHYSNSINYFRNKCYCRLYSPTFLAYPHVCTLFEVFVRHNSVVGLILVYLLVVIILNKLDPDIFIDLHANYITPCHNLTFTVASTSDLDFSYSSKKNYLPPPQGRRINCRQFSLPRSTQRHIFIKEKFWLKTRQKKKHTHNFKVCVWQTSRTYLIKVVFMLYIL